MKIPENTAEDTALLEDAEVKTMKRIKWVQRTRKRRRFVLANRTEAVIYEADRKGRFVFLYRLRNPDGRLSEGALVSDRPGRGFSSAAGGSIHHSLDHEKSHHERLAKMFAGKIGRFLEMTRVRDSYDELVLAAEPHFLGLLRTELSDTLQQMVCHEIPREFVQGSDEELREKVMGAIDRKEGRPPGVEASIV